MEYLWHWNNEVGMFDIYQRVEGELYEIRWVHRVKPGPIDDMTRYVMYWINLKEAVLGDPEAEHFGSWGDPEGSMS